MKTESKKKICQPESVGQVLDLHRIYARAAEGKGGIPRDEKNLPDGLVGPSNSDRGDGGNQSPIKSANILETLVVALVVKITLQR